MTSIHCVILSIFVQQFRKKRVILPIEGLMSPAVSAASILLVEDDQRIADLLTRWLRRQGHSVAAVSTVRAAILSIEDAHFDVLITDLSLPDGDGLEMIRQVRRLQPRLKIFLASGYLTPPLSAAVDGILRKPFGYAELRLTLRKSLAAAS